jgi:hypothetical protein
MHYYTGIVLLAYPVRSQTDLHTQQVTILANSISEAEEKLQNWAREEYKDRREVYVKHTKVCHLIT